MGYRKGTKLVQVPINQEIYDDLKKYAEKDILTKTVPKKILSLIVKYLEEEKEKEKK